MKPRSLRFLPKSLVVCVAPLLVCATASAKVVITNESKNTNVWTLPAGTNLLAGTVPSSAPPVTHEGSSNIWGTLTDGSVGPASPDPTTSVTPNNSNEVVFPLDLTSKPGGYDITSFDSYCAWANTGRDNQDYTLLYSTVANPTTFIPIAAVNNRTGMDSSTHTRITNDTGFLATGVHSIKVIFAHNQENGYTGYREFVLQDTPVTPCVMTEANDNNAFFIPGGTNLLAGITPVEAPAVHEGSSSSWATVTDGSLGDHTNTAGSVTPNNGETVTFPLDLTNHPGGRTIHSFDSFCAWGSNGRDDQNYVLSYSTVADPGNFIPITTVIAHSEFNGPNNRRATHARVTANGGPLATGVHSIRLTFQNQENGYTGFREFFLSDTPIHQGTYEANQTNSWTLPVGTNLLSGATNIDPGLPAGANHGNGDITSSNWGTLSDGSVGSAGTQLHAVAPLNNTSVTYTLDTTVNTLGYNLTSFDAYAAWGDTGRDNQDFTILYSTVSDPATFIPIETIANHTNYPVNATHSRVVPASGFLATNVGAVKFYFNNQENGYVGYREFIVQGAAVPLFSPLTWSGLGGSAGNADWVATADNNWKDGNGSSPFNPLAPLTFDSTGVNTNIHLPAAITAAGMTFSNDNTVPYVFGGEELTVSNGVDMTGSGSAVFNNPLKTSGITLSGSGSLTLAVNNPLTGNATVNNGTLNIASDDALGAAALAQTGGTANFTSAAPFVNSISGTAGSIVLGNPAGGGSDTLLYAGDATATTYAGSITDASPTANGSLFKTGSGSLTLTGANTYTGATTVSDGELKLAKRVALYNGNTASWTASNLVVITDLTLRMGGTGEFTGADVAAIDTGGFDPGAILGLDTTSGNTEITENIGGNVRIEKKGLNSLTLSGSNTLSGGIGVNQGALYAANPGGVSIPSDLTVGNVTFDAFANMVYDGQFGANSILRFNTGGGAVNGKFQMRGTNQTVAGLDSPAINRIAVIQNDEIGSPGYTSDPGACTLTIDVPAETFHSFHGIIRNQAGGSLSLVKKGAGTQELRNAEQVQGYGYNGLTLVEDGTLRINFGGNFTGFASNIYLDPPAHLNFHAAAGNYNFDRIIMGEGDVQVTGTSAVIFRNAANSWTGGTTIDGGFLALAFMNGEALGDGDGPGQTCCAGAMDPSNVIHITNGGTLSLDGPAPLGNSPMLPEYAPSVVVSEGSRIFGGTNSVVFVPNVTLDGGTVEVREGANHGGFGTNLAFVGTLVVGGSSTQPALIHTTGTGDYANISLGSVGLPGTTFQVADVTSSPDADLTISSIIRDVAANPSPLVKTGPGTMSLQGANTYTGATTISGGELTVNGGAIPDGNAVVIDGGKLGVTADETVGTLFFGGVQQIAGTYGSTSSTATYQDDTRFSGTGVLTVTTGPVTDPYTLWAAVIPNAADRDKTDDPDGDGFTNLEEFLFGTSPVANTGSLTETERTGAGLVVRWNQRATTGTYVLRESATMQENPWPASSAPITDNPVQDLPDYVRKQAVIPVDSASKFVRVEATE